MVFLNVLQKILTMWQSLVSSLVIIMMHLKTSIWTSLFVFFWYNGYNDNFLVFLSSLYVNGWIDGARYHGEKYGFHLGYGYLGAPFIGLSGSNIVIDPTIFWYVEGLFGKPSIGLPSLLPLLSHFLGIAKAL